VTNVKNAIKIFFIGKISKLHINLGSVVQVWARRVGVLFFFYENQLHAYCINAEPLKVSRNFNKLMNFFNNLLGSPVFLV